MKTLESTMSSSLVGKCKCKKKYFKVSVTGTKKQKWNLVVIWKAAAPKGCMKGLLSLLTSDRKWTPAALKTMLVRHAVQAMAWTMRLKHLCLQLFSCSPFAVSDSCSCLEREIRNRKNQLVFSHQTVICRFLFLCSSHTTHYLLPSTFSPGCWELTLIWVLIFSHWSLTEDFLLTLWSHEQKTFSAWFLLVFKTWKLFPKDLEML